ncbi:cyclin-dependent kinase inhibitor 5-like [Impatiens glandulifera]|uniref:cyclin-dependent kinase inhibitor 5-like n=1 Tax=Impatiens glandulifera TaxID=253017 RepID=UPI001FB0F50E|nr:cyclin-dependent kinase inhibitor 5-like [Impatiens glandulifera]
MGKYFRKSKPAGEISLMEVSQSSYLGVRTRAKTLALKRLQKLSAPEDTTADAASGSYLQLRSRRLAKPTIPIVDSKRPKTNSSPSPSPSSEGKLGFMMGEKVEIKENGDLSIDQASFGENILDFEGKERISRESTPISLIRDPEIVKTPGSSTRPNNSTESNRAIQNSTRMYIPTTEELNMFFAEAEQQQHREFIEKYNFDPVKDEPLPGRFEWMKLDL